MNLYCRDSTGSRVALRSTGTGGGLRGAFTATCPGATNLSVLSEAVPGGRTSFTQSRGVKLLFKHSELICCRLPSSLIVNSLLKLAAHANIHEVH